MARNRDTIGLNGITEQMPNAGALLDAQRTAAENAARMAGASCHYAMSWNRAWLSFWSSHLAQYTELPKRIADAQSNFFGEAFDHYQESIQELGALGSMMQDEAEDAMKKTQETGKKVAEGLRAQAGDRGEQAHAQKGASGKGGASERQRGQQQKGTGQRGAEQQHQRGPH